MPRQRKVENLEASALSELEGDWRAGLLSGRVIAAKYRVDPDALRNFAVRAGWQRGDLSAAIRESSNRALVERTVAVSQEHGDQAVLPAHTEIVARYSQLAADIVASHRDDAAQGRLHARRLEQELRRVVATLAETAEDSKEQLSIIRSAAETLRCLATTQRLYVDIERQAWGLDKAGAQGATYDDFLAELHGEQPKLANA